MPEQSTLFVTFAHLLCDGGDDVLFCNDGDKVPDIVFDKRFFHIANILALICVFGIKMLKY